MSLMKQTHRITMILAESALETIPSTIRGHPSVQASVRRKKKTVDQILLDKSLHHNAMRNLPEQNKRGRPDIVHICLLLATGSPLYRMDQLKIIVHTINDQLVVVNPTRQWRPPKNYNRFCGLMEQLFSSEKKEIPEKGVPLLILDEMPLKQLLESIGGTILLFTEKGKLDPQLHQIKYLFKEGEQSTVTLVIGGYPHGQFSPDILEMVDHRVSITKHPIEAWTVVSRGIYMVEQHLLG